MSNLRPQGSILAGTSWKYCSFVFSANQPSGEVRIFELTKITFTSAKDINMAGEAYTSDDQCNVRLSNDEVKKLAVNDYNEDFLKLSNKSFTYAVGSEANPSGTYDFDVTDHADYHLYTEIRLTEQKFQLAYACQTEANIMAGDCTAIDGDRSSRRARNFKNEDLVISWTKWE
jgi:hypothetical protein